MDMKQEALALARTSAAEDRAELDDCKSLEEARAFCERLIAEKAAAESGALVSVPAEELERLRADAEAYRRQQQAYVPFDDAREPRHGA